MTAIPMTFGRAMKVWWSYAWRAMVLTIPVTLVMMVLMMTLVPFQKMGTTPNPADMHRMMGRFSLVWVILMVLSIVVQTFAMRWMLRTRWADFRLKAVGREDV